MVPLLEDAAEVADSTMFVTDQAITFYSLKSLLSWGIQYGDLGNDTLHYIFFPLDVELFSCGQAGLSQTTRQPQQIQLNQRKREDQRGFVLVLSPQL